MSKCVRCLELEEQLDISRGLFREVEQASREKNNEFEALMIRLDAVRKVTGQPDTSSETEAGYLEGQRTKAEPERERERDDLREYCDSLKTLLVRALPSVQFASLLGLADEIQVALRSTP